MRSETLATAVSRRSSRVRVERRALLVAGILLLLLRLRLLRIRRRCSTLLSPLLLLVLLLLLHVRVICPQLALIVRLALWICRTHGSGSLHLLLHPPLLLPSLLGLLSVHRLHPLLRTPLRGGLRLISSGCVDPAAAPAVPGIIVA